jgi:hypothetical protein
MIAMAFGALLLLIGIVVGLTIASMKEENN